MALPEMSLPFMDLFCFCLSCMPLAYLLSLPVPVTMQSPFRVFRLLTALVPYVFLTHQVIKECLSPSYQGHSSQ